MQQQISHFKILEEIGSGGMGVVYRARDLRLRRTVALKVLPAGAFAEPMIRERLMREAQTASSLSHPHIVTVYETHSAGDRDFIAMELVDGRSLDHLIGEEGLSLEQALRYGIQIADGLACAHEHGVIHRDLKPQNVMITPSDNVKLLDFGLAKRFVPSGFESEHDSSNLNPGLMTLTAPGVKVGTPAYMSPEQIESREIDARSDIFSFGCLMYEMLTGVPPFSRRNAILIFKAVLSDEPEPVRSLKPKLPARLEKLLIKAMAKAREDRFDSMASVLAELEALHNDLYGTGIYSSRSGVIPMPTLRRPRSLWRPLLSVVGVLAIAVMVWAVISASRPPKLNGYRLISSSRGYQASISPGGQRFAFVAKDRSGVGQIFTQALTGGLPQQHTHEGFSGETPRWLSDRELLFAVRGAGIWTLKLAGGSEPDQLLELGANPRLDIQARQLVVEHKGIVWIADADGRNLQRSQALPPAFFSRWVERSPAFSPDGRSLVYFQPEVGARGSLWVVPVAGGQPRRLIDRRFAGSDPVWTPDGRWIIFAADLSGETYLWCVSAQGGDPLQLTRGSGRHGEPEISADGRHLVYTVTNPFHTLRVRDAETGEERTLHDSNFGILSPALAPTGDRVAFASPSGDGIHLFMVGIDGQGLQQLTSGSGERNLTPQWSRDGTRLYFHQEQPRPSLRALEVASGVSREILPDWSRASRHEARVDPRGERVVYTPIAEGKAGNSRVRHLTTGAEQTLSRSLRSPRWSPNGGLILGGDEDHRIYLCSVSGVTCRYLVDGMYPSWRPDGESMTFVRRARPVTGGHAVEVDLRSLNLETLEQKVLAELTALHHLDFGYGVLDDDSVVWSHVHGGRSELWMVDLE
ncbi:MAG: protein kinase [Acidobacteriota bacterium]